MKPLTRIAMILLAVAATSDARAQRISGHRVGENGIGSATGCSFADTDGTVVLCSQTTPLPADTVVKAATIDRGLSVTAAGTAQQLMPASTSRRGFSVQNQSSGACYINGQAPATQDYHSLLIPAGSYYETPSSHVSTGVVSIVCAVSAASVYAREW